MGECTVDSIVLASTSPRRQELLKALNIPFSVVSPDYEEQPVDGLDAAELAELYSMKKVESVIKLKLSLTMPWVLGADTIICQGSRIFRKPESREEAASMLRSFSGTTHEVITAISLYDSVTTFTTSKTSRNTVHFAPLTDEEIERYLDTGEWQGVAGGYRIQGRAAFFIHRIEGSWSGIVGLPLHELYAILREHGYRI